MDIYYSPATMFSQARPEIVRSSFDVASYPEPYRLLAWRDRVSHVVDVVLPLFDELERPFQARLDCYQISRLVFCDCTSDPMVLERSLARIATDTRRDFVFQVFVEGRADSVSVCASGLGGTVETNGVLAIDMNQPIRMHRSACRVLTFSVPEDVVREVFPDPEFIHGHTLCGHMPPGRMIVDHMGRLADQIGGMTADIAETATRAAVRMLLMALGRHAKLAGSPRALARSLILGQVRHYIQAHLADPDLCPESVLAATQLPRRSLYRLFEERGGLAAYIRYLRLRRAAEELANFPHMPVTDIAYGLGFRSPSDFTRAFRRMYAMAPQDFRFMALSVI